MRTKDLAPNPKNPRKISDAKLDMLKRAMLEFGDLSGIVFNKKSGQLVGGHQRTKWLDPEAEVVVTKKYSKPTKTGTVAVGYLEINGEQFAYREVSWDKHREMAANIAANKGAGDWDMPELTEWMKELTSFDADDFDMSLTMFDEDELEEFGGIIVKEHTRTGATGVDEDEVPEKPVSRTRPGNIYQLGDHRLMCGDSTDAGQVDALLEGQKVDICFTSPPYNLGKFEPSGKKVNVPARKQKYMTVSDDMAAADYQQFLIGFLTICIARSNSTLMNVGLMEANKRPVMRVVNHFIDQFKETLYWKKSTSTPHIQPGIVTSLVEPVFCFGEHGSRCFRNATFKGNCSNVIEGSNAGGNEFAKIHSATFPVYFPEWAISNFSRGSVYDPFGGTGTTMIAAEKLGRKAYLMEIDTHYCDVIVARWEKYTGQKAKLLNPAKMPAATKLRKKAAQQRPEQHA